MWNKIQNKLQAIRKSINRHIIPALLLIVLFNISFTIAGERVKEAVRQSGYMTMANTTARVAEALRDDFLRDLERLNALAAVLAGYDTLDGSQARTLLDSFKENSTISELGIFLPNQRIVLSGEKPYYVGTDSFQEEVEKTPYVSGLNVDPRDETKRFVFQTVAIQKDEEVRGILYEFIDLNALSVKLGNSVALDQAAFQLVDEATGEFLIDTRPALGIDVDKDDVFYIDMEDQFTGTAPFHFPDGNHSFYACHEPVGINQWTVMLMLPEEVTLQTAIKIQYILNIMALMEGIVFLLYIVWLMWKNYQQNIWKERQIAQMGALLDIQQTLFDAHKTPGRVNAALEKTAHALTARKTFLISLHQASGEETYAWPEQEPSSRQYQRFDLEEIRRDVPHAAREFFNGNCILIDTHNRRHYPAPEDRKALCKKKIKSLMLVPIFDSNQHMIGVLGSVNMKQKWENTDFLEGIAHNFMMALENINSYEIIRRMGTMDELTELQNRNSYQKALAEQKDITGCIYLDANGLHDLNNQFGHAAGDAMLKCVGEAMRTHFGVLDTYRIGGDEFVALCRRGTQEDTRKKVDDFCRQIQENGYHVSVGLAWRETPPDSEEALKDLITEAEYGMYAAKRRYYEELGDVSKARNIL